MKTKRIDEFFKEVDSRYALVNAVAKRARVISETAEDNEEILVEKPVLIALDELQNGKTKIVRADSEEAHRAYLVANKTEIRTANTGTLFDFDDDEEDEDEADEEEDSFENEAEEDDEFGFDDSDDEEFDDEDFDGEDDNEE